MLLLFVLFGLSFGVDYDFIVVGSGPGGGPLAARLASQRFKVLVLEAGPDYIDPTIQVPLVFTPAALNPAISWDYWVKHYSDPVQAKRDVSNYIPEKEGVLYPRASGIGGCGLHHVMNLVYPANSDFDNIAAITKDVSWNSDKMRTLWETRVEQNRIFSPPTNDVDAQRTRRGYDGYIPCERADFPTIEKNIGSGFNLFSTVQSFPALAGYEYIPDGDFNSWENNGKIGWGYCPQETHKGQRYGVHQRLKNARRQFPDYLFIETDALVTRVLFKDGRAVGVEYLKGKNLYFAHKQSNPSQTGTKATVFASKEVIISAGTFNSPQLLKLSGIGPKKELEDLGIPVVVDLPGVGSNMQDRYEVALNYKLKSFNVAFNCSFTFDNNDACFQRWKNSGDNFYGTNSILYYTNKKSSSSNAGDLVLFSGPGYFVGYSPRMGDLSNTFGAQSLAYVALKAFTENNAGTVKLRSTDPRQTPLIEFHYFAEGTDASTNKDLQAVLEGVKEMRRVLSLPAAQNIIEREWGSFVNATTDEQIKQKIRDEAWGHHACCTNKIGAASDPMAVLDSNFKVRGVEGLRVVDLSVFPKIPGYFPLAAIYMVSEKAADVISAEYATCPEPTPAPPCSSASHLHLSVFAIVFFLFAKLF